jgi:hypothetical protein
MRTIKEIAQDIQSDWKNVNYGAKPYLEVMHRLNGVDDKFMMDDARSILTYFLSNASSYRGGKAKEIKQEIKNLIKHGTI